MNSTKQRLLTLLLAFLMIITSLPLNVLAASGVSGDKKEITDIKTVGNKQVINLGNVRGEEPQSRFFSRSARLLRATNQQARSSSETVAQKVEINLATMGLNLEEDQFDPSALTEVGSFDVEITFQEVGGRKETRTMTFQAGETKKTETFYLPKDFGNGNVEAEIPKLKDNINLRVYVGANSTTNFTVGEDMSFDFELTQIIHPVIDLKVVDPYGKELQENIGQDLELQLVLEDEHDFILKANTKTFNIRTLSDFAGANIDDLNSTGKNPTLSLTTELDANNKLKVGDKTYKLNKITYNALGQEVEINGQKKKVGGYIEFATQPKIVVPTPDEKGDLPKTPDGYKRLSFHAESSANAQDGRFENGEKLKVIDVLEGTEYTDADLQKQIKGIGQPTPIINGRVDDNKKFLKWKPELPTTEEVDNTDFWPVYLKDGGEITPGEKLPDGVFEVKVVKDDTIAEDALYGKSYGVFQGSKLARDKFPDLEAAKGHQNPKWTATIEGQTVDEAKPWTKVINKNTTFKATASKLPDIIENPTDPTPEGYVRVTFVAGDGVEDFKDAKTYDVKEGTALAEKQYPTAKAKVGYKDPKWDVAPGTAITSANATITATATKIEDIIPGGPDVKKPEGYYTVEFLEGKHGEFKPVKENGTEKPQVTVYYVNPEAKVKMSQIPAPEVTAKVGYKFDSWSKEYEAEAIITGDRQITAVYIYVEGVSTEAKDGWTKVTLKSGTKGQFTKTTNVEGGQPKTEEFDDLAYYVDPAREVTIPAPVVKASVGNTFTGFDKPLTGTFKEETTINAKYLSTSDVIEDKTPGDDTEKPEGYVTVKFDAGQNGKFAPNSVTKFFVNPEKEVEIGAPGVEPNKNFVFKGFFNGTEEHSSAAKKYTKDITYTAKYDDKSNESIIPADQAKPGGWVTISFSAGEHGTFELVEGKQPTIAYHVNPDKDVLLKDKAPAIKANDGYKFTNYDPDVETARKYTTEGQVITAQYEKSQGIIPVEDPENDPVKEGYTRITLAKGDLVNSITGKVAYDVKNDGSVRYGDLIDEITKQGSLTTIKISDSGREPLIWKNGEAEIKREAVPGKTAETITVSATKLDKDANDPTPVEQTVKKGETPNAKDSISNKDDLPKGTTYEFVDDKGTVITPDTSNVGTVNVKVKVTYPDNSSETVDTTIKVVPKDSIIENPTGPKPPEGYARVTLAKDATVATLGDNAVTAYDVRIKDGIRLGDITKKVNPVASKGYKNPTWYEGANADKKSDLLDKITANITLTAKAEKNQANLNTPEAFEQKVEKGKKADPKKSILNPDNLPAGTEFKYVDSEGNATEPKTDTVGKVEVTVKVTYPDGSSDLVKTKIDVVENINIIPVDPKNPGEVPEGYVRVTLTNDKDSVNDYKQIYDVLADGTVRFGDVLNQAPAATPVVGYKDPITWKKDDAEVDKLAKVTGDKTTPITLTAFAEKNEDIIEDPTGEIPEGYVRVTLTNDPTSVKAYNKVLDVRSGVVTYAQVIAKASGVEPAVGYKLPITWKKDNNEVNKTSKVTGDKTTPITLTAFAANNDDVIENPIGETPEGYVRVTFVNDKTSVKTYKKVMDIKSGSKNYAELLTHAKGVEPEAGYKEPITWMNGKATIDETAKVTGDKTTPITLTAYATENDDIIENPTGPTPEGYVRVKLVNGDTSVKKYEKILDVKNDKVTYQEAIDKASDIEPAVGYKLPITWKKDGSEINPSVKIKGSNDVIVTLKAYATNNDDIIENPTEPTPEGYVRVTFVNDKTSVKTYKKVIDVKSNSKTYAELLTKVTDVKPAVGYTTPITWKNGENTIKDEDKVRGDKDNPITLTAYAEKNGDIIEDPTGETPEGYVRVTLKNDTTTVQSYNKTFDVLADGSKRYGDILAKATDAKPADGYTTPITWKKDNAEVDKLAKVTGDKNSPITLTAYATENANIIEDPTGPTPAGYVRVKLVNDKTSVKTFEKILDVKSNTETYATVVAKAKNVVPAIGYKLPITWKNGETVIDTAANVVGTNETIITLTAYARKNDDIIVNPTEPTPEGYVRVIFVNGSGIKDFKTKLTYDVRIGTALTKDKYPQVELEAGFENPVWSTKPGTAITADNNIIRASATSSTNVIPVEPGTDKPAGYVTVTFKADKTKGSLDGVTQYYVNSKVKVSLNAPKVEPKIGYEFTKWDKDPTQETLYGKDTDITAEFDVLADKIEAKDGDKKPEGYVEIRFAVDTNKGTAKGTTRYFVNPNKDVELTAPTVDVTDPKYTFNDKWDTEFSGSRKYPKDLTITAVFESSKVDAPDVDEVITGDTTVNVNPGDADKVTVVVEGQGTVVVEKDPNGTWKTPDGKVVTPEADGKLPVPVKPIGEKALVEVTVEKDGVGSEKVSKTAQKVLALLVATLTEGKRGITVTTNPSRATVKVYLNNKLIKEVVTSDLGIATIILDAPMKEGQSYKIKAELDGYISKENVIDVVGKTK